MEAHSRPQGRPESSLRKTAEGGSWLGVWLAAVALVVGMVFVPYRALAQTPSVPSSPSASAASPTPPGASSAGTSVHHVTVYGEVGRQGKYDFVAGETVGRLILRVGGFSAKAKDKAVKVIRKVPGGGNVTLVVNVRDVLSGKAPGKDIPLSPNDTVIVEEKLISF